jgi:hypothetical protein
MAKRIVIKAGTSVVSTPDGFPSLSRMADIVEHVSPLLLFAISYLDSRSSLKLSQKSNLKRRLLPCWLYTLYLVQNISDSRDDINHFTHTRLLNLFEAARKSSLLHQELWELAGKD